MAVVGGCGGAVATSIAVGEAVDVDALQLLADVGKLGVGTVRRGLGPAVKMRTVSSFHPLFNEWLFHLLNQTNFYRMICKVAHYLVLTSKQKFRHKIDY